MSDLTRRIVEKITEEISGEEKLDRIPKKVSKTTQKENKGRKKEKNNEIIIKNPEFSFIFTIALNGKLDINYEIAKNLSKQNYYTHQKINGANMPDTANEPSSRKDPQCYDILDQSYKSKTTAKNNSPFMFARLEESDKSYLQHSIFRTFTDKAVQSYWKYNASNNILDDILTITKKDYFEEGGDLSKLTEDIFKVAMAFTAEVKLFSIGVLSILIKNEQPFMTENRNDISFSPKEIMASLKNADIPVTKNRFVVDSKKITLEGGIGNKGETRGFLNIFAFNLASKVFNDFFRYMSKHNNRLSTNFLMVSRICEESRKGVNLVSDMFERGIYTDKVIKAVISRPPDCKKLSARVNFYKDKKGKSYIEYRGDPKKRDEILLYKQYEDSEEDLISLVKMFAILKKPPERGIIELPKALLAFYKEKENPNNAIQRFVLKKELEEIAGKLWNAPLCTNPYIGIKFNSVPEIYIEKNRLNPDVFNLLFNKGTPTYKYMNGSYNKQGNILRNDSYLKEQNDVIVVQNQGIYAIEDCYRKKNDKPYNGHDTVFLSGTPYDILIFCLESIIATTKSTKSFYKELNEDVHYKIDNMLNKRFSKLWVAFYKNKPITYIGVIAGIVLSLFACGLPAIANYTMFIFIICHLVSILRNHHVINKSNDIIIRARKLSPCNDFSNDIVAALESETIIKGVTIAKGFGLNALNDAINRRIEIYEKFIKSCYGSLTAKANWLLVFLVLYIGMGNLLFMEYVNFSWKALLDNLGIDATQNENLIQFLTNLIF